MKRNRLFILGIVTVLVALLSLTLVSGTYAKYTSSATGSDSARVAKWSVTYDGSTSDEQDVAQTASITFDLFNTINEADTTTAEADVKKADSAAATQQIIAPGTGGEFSFVLENKSEVTINFDLDYTLTNTGNIPLEFRVKRDDGSYGEWTNELVDVAASAATKLAIKADPATGAEKTTYTIQWRWAFVGSASANHTSTQTDVTDTALGSAATLASASVELIVTFTQVD